MINEPHVASSLPRYIRSVPSGPSNRINFYNIRYLLILRSPLLMRSYLSSDLLYFSIPSQVRLDENIDLNISFSIPTHGVGTKYKFIIRVIKSKFINKKF